MNVRCTPRCTGNFVGEGGQNGIYEIARQAYTIKAMADIDDDESGDVAAIAAISAVATTTAAAVDSQTKSIRMCSKLFRTFIHSFIRFVGHANPHVVYRFRFGFFCIFKIAIHFRPVVLMIKCRGQMNSCIFLGARVCVSVSAAATVLPNISCTFLACVSVCENCFLLLFFSSNCIV